MKPYKRSIEHEWTEQEEKYWMYFQQLGKRFMPIIEYCWQEGGYIESYWAMMEKQGVKSHCMDAL